MLLTPPHRLPRHIGSIQFTILSLFKAFKFIMDDAMDLTTSDEDDDDLDKGLTHAVREYSCKITVLFNEPTTLNPVFPAATYLLLSTCPIIFLPQSLQKHSRLICPHRSSHFLRFLRSRSECTPAAGPAHARRPCRRRKIGLVR